MNQSGTDLSLYICDDPVLKAHGYKGALIEFFSTRNEVSNGTYLSGKRLVTRIAGKVVFPCDTSDLKLRGEHNYANAAAAITLASKAGVPTGIIRDGLFTFEAVEHRLEAVPSQDGIIYINDSKATNVDSVIYALKSFDAPIYLILGGIDKETTIT